MFGSELDQLFVLVVVVRAEGDLLEVSTRALALARRPYLVYGGGDRCDFQNLPEVANGEVANTDAPVKVDASDTEGVRREWFGYVVSPSF